MQSLQPDSSITIVNHVGSLDAPHPSEFPSYPVGWHLFGRTEEVEGGRPVSKDFFGRRIVVWRPSPRSSGEIVAMEGRCWHLGADLGNGCVISGALQCPFHHWEYAPDGRCRRIPAQESVPLDIRQKRYAVTERAGFIFIANSQEVPPFAAPFFEDVIEDDLVAAKPIELEVQCPWYLVGANGFDVQHFRAAHDRSLKAAPVIDSPSRFCRRIVVQFAVTGKGWRDRLTRIVAGPVVEMRVIDWCGSLIFVHARFARTSSYGMVSIRPLGTGRTQVHVTVFARAGCSWLSRKVLSPINAKIKRYFIQAFLRPDIQRLAGAAYHPARLVEADEHLSAYFRWLADVSCACPERGT